MHPDPQHDLPSFTPPATEGGPSPDIALPGAPGRARVKETMQLRRPTQPVTETLRDIHAGSKTTPDIHAQADLALSHDLILLLSKLEYLRVRLAGAQTTGQAGAALQTFAQMLDAVQGTAQRHLEADAAPELRTEAAALAAAIDELQPHYRGTGLRGLLQMFQSSGMGTAARRKAFRHAARRLLQALESFFELFATRFESPAGAGEWAQTSGVFLAELRSALDQFPG